MGRLGALAHCILQMPQSLLSNSPGMAPKRKLNTAGSVPKRKKAEKSAAQPEAVTDGLRGELEAAILDILRGRTGTC